MRILLLNYEYPPLGGGAANATYHLVRELVQTRNVEIDLVTSSASSYRVERPHANLSLHFLDIRKQGSLHYQSMQDLLSFSWKSYFYARRLVERRRIQLIHAFFGIPSGFTALQFDLPYIVSLRGSDVPFYNPRFELLDRLVFKELSKRIWREASCVVANSKGLRRLARVAAPEQQIEVIANGVDTDLFTPRGVNGNSHRPLRIVSTGRLIQRKGYDVLLDALENWGEFELVLVGDGDQKNFLAEKARANGVRVEFRGRLEREDLIHELREADLFVLPSLNEGMSNSLLEAMACGLPIITTRVGGSDELVEDGKNGFVVEKKSVRGLRSALASYMSRRELLEEHGAASREAALEMDWNHVSREYLKLYETAVGSTV